MTCAHVFKPHCGCSALGESIFDAAYDRIMAEYVKNFFVPLIPIRYIPPPEPLFQFQGYYGSYGFPLSNASSNRRSGIGAVHVNHDPGDVDDGFLKRSKTR